jgi:hypothetical protein
MAVEVEPEEDHEREEVAEMEGRRGRVDSSIYTYSFGVEELVEEITVAAIMSVCRM